MMRTVFFFFLLLIKFVFINIIFCIFRIIKKCFRYVNIFLLNIFLVFIDYYLLCYQFNDNLNHTSNLVLKKKSKIYIGKVNRFNATLKKKKKRKKRLSKEFLLKYTHIDEFDGTSTAYYYQKFKIKYPNTRLTKLKKQQKVYNLLMKHNYALLENTQDLYEIFNKCYSRLTAKTARERLYRYKYFEQIRQKALYLREPKNNGNFFWYSHPCWWWWVDDDDDELFYFLLDDFMAEDEEELVDYLPEVWDDWVDFLEEYEIDDISNDFVGDWWGAFFIDTEVYRIWNLLKDNDEDIWDDVDIYLFFLKRGYEEKITTSDEGTGMWVRFIELFLYWKIYYGLRLEYWLIYIGWRSFYLPYSFSVFKSQVIRCYRHYRTPLFLPTTFFQKILKWFCCKTWFWYLSFQLKYRQFKFNILGFSTPFLNYYYYVFKPKLKKIYFWFKVNNNNNLQSVEVSKTSVFFHKILSFFDLVIVIIFVFVFIYSFFYKLENDPFILYLIEIFAVVYAIFYYIGLQFGPRFIILKYILIICCVYGSTYLPWDIIEPYCKLFYDFCEMFCFANFEKMELYLNPTRIGFIIGRDLVYDDMLTGNNDEPAPACFTLVLYYFIMRLNFGILMWFSRFSNKIEGYAINFLETKQRYIVYNSNGVFLILCHFVNLFWQLIPNIGEGHDQLSITVNQYYSFEYFYFKHSLEYITVELWDLITTVFLQPYFQLLMFFQSFETVTKFSTLLLEYQFPFYQSFYMYPHFALNSSLPLILKSFWVAIFLILLIFVILILTYLFSPKTLNFSKFAPYECGFDPYGDARSPFDINFYFVAILFLIFDLEIVLLFLWVFSIVDYSLFFYGNFFSLIYFFLLLGIGFIYEWFSGGLDWASFIRKRLQIY